MALLRYWPAFVIAGTILWFVFPGVTGGVAAAFGIGAVAMGVFLAEFFILGGLGFWLLFSGLFGTMCWFTHREWPGLAFALALITGALCYLVYGFNPLLWAYENKQIAVILFGGYFAVGVAWMFLKWGFWVQKLMDILKPNIEYFSYERATTAGLTKGTDQYKAVLYQYLETQIPSQFGFNFPPMLSRNKSRLTFWLGLWPFSMVGTLINEPLRKLIDFLYERLTGVLGWITNQVIAWNLKGHI